MSTPEGITTALDPVLAEHVGEGKKYKTVADFVKSRLEADQFISQLQSENATLRDIVKDGNMDQTAQQMKDFLATLQTQSTTTTIPPIVTDNVNQTNAGLTEDQVRGLYEQMEQDKRRKANLESLDRDLMKSFGEKTAEVKAARLKELGITDEVFQTLASTSPQAAKSLLIKDGASTLNLQSTVNTGAEGGSQVRNREYYRKLRKEMPESEYQSTEIQQQMLKDAALLGPDFYKSN